MKIVQELNRVLKLEEEVRRHFSTRESELRNVFSVTKNLRKPDRDDPERFSDDDRCRDPAPTFRAGGDPPRSPCERSQRMPDPRSAPRPLPTK
jgi:hypothetical protein